MCAIGKNALGIGQGKTPCCRSAISTSTRTAAVRSVVLCCTAPTISGASACAASSRVTGPQCARSATAKPATRSPSPSALAASRPGTALPSARRRPGSEGTRRFAAWRFELGQSVRKVHVTVSWDIIMNSKFEIWKFDFDFPLLPFT